MNNTEATALCRLVQAYCPQQRIDEFTPDAWAEVLANVRFVDAKAALIAIVRRQPFVAVGEIIAEVRVIRDQRIALHRRPEPPPDLPDDEVSYRRWLRTELRRIADGDVETQTVYDLPERDMRLIEPTFPRVPNG